VICRGGITRDIQQEDGSSSGIGGKRKYTKREKKRGVASHRTHPLGVVRCIASGRGVATNHGDKI